LHGRREFGRLGFLFLVGEKEKKRDVGFLGIRHLF
jgi:hypothetical protein